jgi:hypothetical protein
MLRHCEPQAKQSRAAHLPSPHWIASLALAMTKVKFVIG